MKASGRGAGSGGRDSDPRVAAQLVLHYNNPEICLSQLANCRWRFWLDRLGRCLKLFVSTVGESSPEFFFL